LFIAISKKIRERGTTVKKKHSENNVLGLFLLGHLSSFASNSYWGVLEKKIMSKAAL
jgi:hypothetical protein